MRRMPDFTHSGSTTRRRTARRAKLTVAFTAVALLQAVRVAPGAMSAENPRVVGVARSNVEGRCGAAALSVTGVNNAALEVRPAATALGAATALPSANVTIAPTIAPTTVVPTSLSAPRLVEWNRGELPGRFVAVVEVTRSGRRVLIRATLENRVTPCRLVTWRFVTTN